MEELLEDDASKHRKLYDASIHEYIPSEDLADNSIHDIPHPIVEQRVLAIENELRDFLSEGDLDWIQRERLISNEY